MTDTDSSKGNVVWFTKEQLKEIFPPKIDEEFCDLQTCKICGGTMKIGRAIKTEDAFVRVCFSKKEPDNALDLVWVFKCSECGHSLLPVPKAVGVGPVFNLREIARKRYSE